MNNHALNLLFEMAPHNTWITLSRAQLDKLASFTVCNKEAQQILTHFLPNKLDFTAYS